MSVVHRGPAAGGVITMGCDNGTPVAISANRLGEMTGGVITRRYATVAIYSSVLLWSVNRPRQIAGVATGGVPIRGRVNKGCANA